MRTEDIQRIIDHFHIGKIIEQKNLVYFYEVLTNQGTFYLLSGKVETARQTEEARIQKVVSITGSKVERLLLKNYKNELNPENSYTHSRENYYSLYKQI